jgi:UDP-glucose 4-epimerase
MIHLPRSLKNKTFLITGGAGFIGSHVADAILRRGGKVVIVDNLSTGRKENIPAKAYFQKMNIADGVKLDALVKKYHPDYIYHFAYYVIVPKSIQDPLLDMDCFRGSLNIILAARKHGVKKIIFSSSGFVYGNTPNLPIKESAPHQPVSPYAITKDAIEGYLSFYKKNFGLDFVIFRNAAVYGPRQITGAMAAYIRDLKAGVPPEFYGLKTRDYVYIDDVVNANLLALSIPASYQSPIFNLGAGVETNLVDLYHMLAKILDKKARAIRCPDRPGEQGRYYLDVSKVHKELGWKPVISLEVGLRKTLEYWKML